MTGSSRKDLSVYDFDGNEAEWDGRELLHTKSCRSPNRKERSRLTRDDFKHIFSKKSELRQAETGDEASSEDDMSCDVGKRTGNDTGDQNDSINGDFEIGHLISGVALQAKGALVISEPQNCGGLCLTGESVATDDPMRGISNNDDDKQLSCTPSSEDNLVDLTSDDEGASSMKLSPSNAFSGSAGEEDASEYSTSDNCHKSDGYFDRESKSMEVVVTPEFGLYGNITFLMPRLTFSAECVRLEIKNQKCSDEVYVFQWGLFDMGCFKTHWLKHANVAVLMLGLSQRSGMELEAFFSVAGISSLLFAVNDVKWHEEEKRIMSLCDSYKIFWRPLNENEDQREGAMCGVLLKGHPISNESQFLTRSEENFEDFVFPKGDPDAVTITKRDLELLRPETFINDTLIDFYIKYLQTKIPQKRREACHFFNSFFFRKLADLDKDPGNGVISREAFQRVRKWTRKVNIFEKDYIFIPVNYSLHWSLIVICHPGEAPVLEDDSDSKTPCILHMDSIRGSHVELRNLIQSYLWEEWKERQTEDEESFEIASKKFFDMPFVPVEVPQQENSFDCGLFLLHYVELFLEEAPVNFNLLQLQNPSKFLTRHWFAPYEASSLKRYTIQKLIHTLHDELSGISPAVCYGTSHQSAQSDTGTDQAVEFVLEDHAPNQMYLENSFMRPNKAEEIPVCHMDEANAQTSIYQMGKSPITEALEKAFEVGSGEYDGIGTLNGICSDEAFRSCHQNASLQLKSNLRETLERMEESTEDFASGTGVNQLTANIFYSMVGTNEPPECEKETASAEVPSLLSLQHPISLITNELNPITGPSINQQEEHPGSSKRILCKEGSTSTRTSTSSESLNCVRKNASCSTRAWKKPKFLDDRSNIAEKRLLSEGNGQPAIATQQNADEINISLEPRYCSDISQCHANIPSSGDNQVLGNADIPSNIGMGLQKENAGCLKVDSQNNANVIPYEQQQLESMPTENLKLHDVSNQCATESGTVENHDKGIEDFLISCQTEQNFLACKVNADFPSVEKLKLSSHVEDRAGSVYKTPEKLENGKRCEFKEFQVMVGEDGEHAASVSKTIEILDKPVKQEDKAKPLQDSVEATCRTPDGEHKSSPEGGGELLSSDDFNSPSLELPIPRVTRSKKTPSTVPKLRSNKGTPLIQERPRTRSVTKRMVPARLARDQRRRNLNMSTR